jgi:enterochelin esterase-like enzyme
VLNTSRFGRPILGANKTAAMAPAAKPATKHLTSFAMVIVSSSYFHNRVESKDESTTNNGQRDGRTSGRE